MKLQENSTRVIGPWKVRSSTRTFIEFAVGQSRSFPLQLVAFSSELNVHWCESYRLWQNWEALPINRFYVHASDCNAERVDVGGNERFKWFNKIKLQIKLIQVNSSAKMQRIERSNAFRWKSNEFSIPCPLVIALSGPDPSVYKKLD